MALFKSKAKSKVDELLELFNDLNDEELEEFINKADLDGDGDVDEEDAKEIEGKEGETVTKDEKDIEKAKEDAEKKGEEPTKAEIDESVGEQEYLDDDKDSQSAKDRVDESEGEEKAEEKIEEHEEEDATKISEMIREILREELKPILEEEFKKMGFTKGQSVEEADEKEKNSLKSIESIYNS